MDLLIAKAEDVYSKCDKYASPVFSSFLDEAQQMQIEENIGNRIGYNTMYFGGHGSCERRMMGVFPEWQEADEAEFPITCIRVEHRFAAPMSHREYLGSILGLGIDRSKTGDIFIKDNTAYVFVCSDIAGYITSNLSRVGHNAVKVTECKRDTVQLPEREFKVINAVAASERADAVIAAALNVSRSVSAGLISSGLISINHKALESAAKPLHEGDLISARGYGRFRISEFGANTRTGRMHLTVKKYI